MMPQITDKETDEFWDMTNQLGAGWDSRAVLVKKMFGADYEQIWGPFLKYLWAKNKFKFFFENIVASAQKICIE